MGFPVVVESLKSTSLTTNSRTNLSFKAIPELQRAAMTLSLEFCIRRPVCCMMLVKHHKTYMRDLILRSGPVLIARTLQTDGKQEDGRWDELDVTDCAHERIFDFVTMDAAVTAGDIFRLLDASPLLQQVFRRAFTEELCAETRRQQGIGHAVDGATDCTRKSMGPRNHVLEQRIGHYPYAPICRASALSSRAGP